MSGAFAGSASGDGGGGSLSIADFESAVLLVMNPPPASSASPAALASVAAATAFIQRLATLPEAHRLCVRLLAETRANSARFFSLQALEQFVLYTGVRQTQAQFEKAVAFARS